MLLLFILPTLFQQSNFQVKKKKKYSLLTKVKGKTQKKTKSRRKEKQRKKTQSSNRCTSQTFENSSQRNRDTGDLFHYFVEKQSNFFVIFQVSLLFFCLFKQVTLLSLK